MNIKKAKFTKDFGDRATKRIIARNLKINLLQVVPALIYSFFSLTSVYKGIVGIL